MSDARNTVENKCFSGLDYDLVKDLFGKNSVSNISRILCDSPSIASDFEFSQSQPESLDKQSKSVNSVENNRPSMPEGETLCESSASVIPTSAIRTDVPLSSESEIDDSDADPDYDNVDRIESTESDESSSTLSEMVQDENMKSKTRKRKANPALWKRNRTKALRNSGQEYKTLKNGKMVPSRTIGLPCTNSCRRRCTLKISEDERKEYFQSFWSLKDLNRQRQFIANSMELIQLKYTGLLVKH